MARSGTDADLIEAFNDLGTIEPSTPRLTLPPAEWDDAAELEPLPAEEDNIYAPMPGVGIRPMGVVGESR